MEPDVIAASMLGGVAFPPLLGRAIEQTNVRAVPVILFVLALTCVVTSLALRRSPLTGRYRGYRLRLI